MSHSITLHADALGDAQVGIRDEARLHGGDRHARPEPGEDEGWQRVELVGGQPARGVEAAGHGPQGFRRILGSEHCVGSGHGCLVGRHGVDHVAEVEQARYVRPSRVDEHVVVVRHRCGSRFGEGPAGAGRGPSAIDP